MNNSRWLLEWRVGAWWLAALLSMRASAASLEPVVDAAITTDPARDAVHPAAMFQVAIPSHESLMFGVFYRAAGGDPHPTVVAVARTAGF